MKNNKKQQQRYQHLSMQLPHLEPWRLWGEVFHTVETWRGQHFFLYPKREEPTFGLPDLAHILPIANSNPHQVPLLALLDENLTQFGLIGVTQETNLQEEQKAITMQTLLSSRWLFVLEWLRNMSAWDALLFTFDHINPVLMSLEPPLVLPTLFVARMADHPRASVFEMIQAWAPLLDRTQDLLLPLIYALYLRWSEGPSQAAAKLRVANNPEGETIDEDTLGLFQDMLDVFTHVFGFEPLETVLYAERLVPALLRCLDEVSWSLWNPTTHLQVLQQSALSAASGLYALLPIALWHPQPPISLDIHNILSLEQLYQIWQFKQEQKLRGKMLKGASNDSP